MARHQKALKANKVDLIIDRIGLDLRVSDDAHLLWVCDPTLLACGANTAATEAALPKQEYVIRGGLRLVASPLTRRSGWLS
jgi:hypothetical protein